MDFNGDGLTDLILVSRDAVFGYAQVQHPGSLPFSALIAILIVTMAVTIFTEYSNCLYIGLIFINRFWKFPACPT